MTALDCIVFPPNSYVASLTPSVMVFGDIFGYLAGHEGGALRNGISALVRKDTREMTSLSVM